MAAESNLSLSEAITQYMQFESKVLRSFEPVKSILLAAQDAENSIVAKKERLVAVQNDLDTIEPKLEARQRAADEKLRATVAEIEARQTVLTQLNQQIRTRQDYLVSQEARLEEVEQKILAGEAKYEAFRRQFA